VTLALNTVGDFRAQLPTSRMAAAAVGRDRLEELSDHPLVWHSTSTAAWFRSTGDAHVATTRPFSGVIVFRGAR
jgi:hypothetical protein